MLVIEYLTFSHHTIRYEKPFDELVLNWAKTVGLGILQRLGPRSQRMMLWQRRRRLPRKSDDNECVKRKRRLEKRPRRKQWNNGKDKKRRNENRRRMPNGFVMVWPQRNRRRQTCATFVRLYARANVETKCFKD
jgi:hypothetical protein